LTTAIALMTWLEANRPAAFAEIMDKPATPDGRGYLVLNELTGLNIEPSEDFHASCGRYLQALRASA
jgi:hypothetical protein